MISQMKTNGAGPSRGVTAGKKKKSDYAVHKVTQALDILEQFRDDVDELTVIELSRRLHMREGRVDRLLATLMAHNYIEQNRGTRGYRLGFKNLKMAQTVLYQTKLYRIAHPVLASLAEVCGETASVAVLNKSHIIEVGAVHSKHPVQVRPRAATHLPVHCTSAGKLLIALEAGQARERLFQGGGLDRYTPNTVTSVEELSLHLQRVAEKGYAVDDEESDREVRSVAAAVRDHSGRVVGAVVITGPSCRIGLDRLAGELIPLVQGGARDISCRLGYQQEELQPTNEPFTNNEWLAQRSRS